MNSNDIICRDLLLEHFLRLLQHLQVARLQAKQYLGPIRLISYWIRPHRDLPPKLVHDPLQRPSKLRLIVAPKAGHDSPERSRFVSLLQFRFDG